MDSGTTTTPGTPQRNRSLANSLLLHLRPARVPLRAIRFRHTFGLGGMAMVLILLLMASGLLMGFVYDPAPERAYRSILVLQEDLLFGRLIRGIHYWSANLLVVVAGLHLLRVFPTGPFPEAEFYRARLEDGGFLALHRKCTHLGCSVPRRPEKERFERPCHASAFDIRGPVLSSPAPRPLDRFAVAIDNGRILVDTTNKLRRGAFEPEQVARIGADE